MYIDIALYIMITWLEISQVMDLCIDIITFIQLMWTEVIE